MNSIMCQSSAKRCTEECDGKAKGNQLIEVFTEMKKKKDIPAKSLVILQKFNPAMAVSVLSFNKSDSDVKNIWHDA